MFQNAWSLLFCPMIIWALSAQSRDIAQIVSRQNVQSTHVKRSDLQRNCRPSSDTAFLSCSDGIPKTICACFFFGGGGITQLLHNMLQNGVLYRCACGTKYLGGVLHQFGRVPTSLKRFRERVPGLIQLVLTVLIRVLPAPGSRASSRSVRLCSRSSICFMAPSTKNTKLALKGCVKVVFKGYLRRPGDSQRESGRFTRIDSRESIRRETPISQCASDSRESPHQTCDSQFLAPQSVIRKKRGSVGEPWNDSRESGDSRESSRAIWEEYLSRTFKSNIKNYNRPLSNWGQDFPEELQGHFSRTYPSQRGKNLGHSDLEAFKRTNVQNWISLLSGVAPANQRKASSWTFRRGVPEQKFNVNRACFPKEKHQNSQKWAKFMNFSFWPFLWFGLPGRLLILC